MEETFLDLSEAPEDTGFTSFLYRRKPVNDLHQVLRFVVERQWRTLELNEDNPLTFAHVFGPPGSGKSCASWAWAHHARKQSTESCSFAYVQCEMEICYLTKPDGQRVEISLTELESTLKLGDSKRVICVFDQALQYNIHLYVAMIYRFLKASFGVILVSPGSLYLNRGTFQGIETLRHRFPGWTKEEYSAAIAYQPFFEEIKATAFGEGTDYADRNLLLDEKFHFAGHSARYMLTKTTGEVKGEIEYDIGRVGSSLTAGSVMKMLSSPCASGAINSLMSWLAGDGNGVAPDAFDPLILDGQWPDEDLRHRNFSRNNEKTYNCFVSHFAGQTWAKINEPSSATLKVLGEGVNEMAIVGYAFQQRFFEATFCSTVSGAKEFSLLVGDARESWTISKYSTTDPADVLDAEDAQAGRFFWCAGTTAAYDAVLVYDDQKIRFIQVTVGKSHTFKISWVDSLLRTLEGRGITFTHVDFVVVRPLGDKREFTLETPVGSLDQWKDYTGTQWRSGADCRNQVRFGRLGWS